MNEINIVDTLINNAIVGCVLPFIYRSLSKHHKELREALNQINQHFNDDSILASEVGTLPKRVRTLEEGQVDLTTRVTKLEHP